MIAAYYESMFIISILLALIYVFIWHKHFDIHITLMFILVPVTNLGFALMAQAKTFDAAMLASKLTYIGCFLLLNIMLGVFSLCDIKMPLRLKAFFLVLCSSVYIIALFSSGGDMFYTEVSYSRVGGMIMFNKKYGPLHHLFYGMILMFFLFSLWAMLYSYFRKNQVSRNIIYLLFVPELLSIISFFFGRKLLNGAELVPAAYNLSLVVFLLIVYRICLYNISDSALESMVQSGDTGFASFDFKLNYLGSNETAKAMMPPLMKLTVDKPAAENEFMRGTVVKWLENFREDNKNDTVLYEKYGTAYLVNITYLYDGRRNRGYQLFIKDDTKNQEYIKLINSFNSKLQKEVEAKTEHVIEMQNKLVLGMATMVESRDNSTGGHIKRTSDVVKLLIAEIKKDNKFGLTDEFCKNVIKAAPMHDLGKIAVNDAILRKPGRFTQEEYDQMKTHAAEGARIVHEILKGTDDKEFRKVAENVAHYHHEYWDGTGYPEGLKGEQIPMEARIMAIADVYDALVSKRVYKDSLSYDKINQLIIEGMGIQFDKELEPYYLRARPRIENYYNHTEH